MASILALSDNGAGSGPMVAVMNEMLGDLLPTTTPRETGMSLGTISEPGPMGDGPTDAMTMAIINSGAAQANNSIVAFQNEISSDLAPFFTGMAYTDTSYQSTDEGINDQIFENPIAATPWSDGSDQYIRQYDPLFIYNTNHKGKRSPNFEIVATPPMINQIQARLQQKENDAALYGMRDTTNLRQRGAVPIHQSVHDGTPSGKRMRLYDVGNLSRVPAATAPSRVNIDELETLRFYGSLTPEGLHAKLEFMGPVTQIYDSTGPQTTGSMGQMSRINERLINHSFYSRGKIQNLFGEQIQKGESLFFTIAKYSRDQLLAMNAPMSVVGRKRGYDTVTNSSFVGLGQNSVTSNEFTQVRGWNSGDGQEYLASTEPLEMLNPAVYDRFYCDRMRRAAVEYVDYEYDPMTDELRPIPTLRDEGLQAAIESLPDVIIENYLAPGIIIPVGVVRQAVNKRINKIALLNAHYDQAALAVLPHVEIGQNRI